MKISYFALTSIAVLSILLTVGCGDKAVDESDEDQGKSSSDSENDQDGDRDDEGAHSHGEDDALIWRGESIEEAGLVIRLGHHGTHLHAGEEVEPAVSITRDGEAVSDAKVFNALYSADGTTELAKEVATVYEPTTADEPAHYAQGAQSIPKGVIKGVTLFRIVPAAADAGDYDIAFDGD